MKNLIILSFILIGISIHSDASSRTDGKKKLSLRKPDIVDKIVVGYNNWSYTIWNNGSYMYDPYSYEGGGEFPRGSGINVMSACGLWIGTFKNGRPVVTESRYGSDFQPGRIVNSGLPFDQLISEDPSTPLQKVYLIDRKQSGDDFQNWPQDAQRNSEGSPALIGDAQTWSVFNDQDTSTLWWNYPPEDVPLAGLGIEVTMESFVSTLPILREVVYFKVTIENHTDSVYDSTFFGAFMDADLIQYWNDYAGCDSVRGLGFIYNGADESPNDRAIGIDILQGPVVKLSDIQTDLASRFSINRNVLKYDESTDAYAPLPLEDGKIWLGATAYTDMLRYAAFGDIPHYNFLQGKADDGSMKYGVGRNYKFAFPGNPVTQQGSPYVMDGTGFDEHVLLSTGPFTLEPGKIQEIWFAVIGATGIDRLDAVQNMFDTDDKIQSVFEKGLFPTNQYPAVPETDVTPMDNRILISWRNNAEFIEDHTGEILCVSIANGYTADYVKRDFEGYRVYRSYTGLPESFRLLAEYDKINQYGIVNNFTVSINNNLVAEEINIGNNTGLNYYFSDETVVNGQKYFYSVTSYDVQPYIAGPDEFSFNGVTIPRPSGLPVSLESDLFRNVFSAVPSKPISSNMNDAELEFRQVQHLQGADDGDIILTVIDPTKITGHTYRIEFFNIPSIKDGKTLVGLSSGVLAYRIIDSNRATVIPFSSHADNPSTFYDSNNNFIFDGNDDILDETYFSSAINTDFFNRYDLADGLMIEFRGPFGYFKSIQYVPGPQYRSVNISKTWFGRLRFMQANELGEGNLGITSPSTALNEKFFENVFSAQQLPQSLRRDFDIVFSRDSSKWQNAYATTGDGRLSILDRFVRVPFRVFEVDTTDGNNDPIQLNIKMVDRSIAGTAANFWGLFNGGYHAITYDYSNLYLSDSTGPQMRGWFGIDTSSYDLQNFQSGYGELSNGKLYNSTIGDTSDRDYGVFQPTILRFDYPIQGAMDGKMWNDTAKFVFGNNTNVSSTQQAYIYRLIPDEGTLQIRVHHGFDARDIYRFSTKANSVITSKKELKRSLKDIKVVPNPFYKYSTYESNFDKLIKFTHLPEVCTIKIFTVAGDLIKTIKHNSTSNNDRVNDRPYDEEYEPGASATSIERWDLKTANGRYVASGMYIALVESPAGKRLVKFAIIQ